MNENAGVPEKCLPIGTVVRLCNGTKKVMIFGRMQVQISSNRTWDYVACLYPEGNLDDRYNVFFNHYEIEEVYFIGCQDDEGLFTRQLLLDADD